MERSRIQAGGNWMSWLLVLAMLTSATGCQQILTTAVYMWSGTDDPAEYSGLEGKRVVVVCRPPPSLEYSDAGASRELAKRIGSLLAANVEDIDVADATDVDDWADENDSEKFLELAEAVNAEMVVYVEMDSFSLYNGQTLYQGKADVSLTVYEMDGKKGRVAWEKPIGQILFPENSSVPRQEKGEPQFRRQFIQVLSERIASRFYEHDPYQFFALDATALR